MNPTQAPENPLDRVPLRRRGWEEAFLRWRDGGSGPRVARAFHRWLALCQLVAWASLGTQVQTLLGSRGLLPFAPWLEASGVDALPWWRFPCWLRWDPSDLALTRGVYLGLACAAMAALGVLPRFALGVSTALYLGYALAGRSFLAFQWDNLLLECGALAIFLPRERRAPVAHFLLRALLFKLYWESGVAKWNSPLHDWQDGTAMGAYYETAPLPTWVGWYMHHLPPWWHALESRAVLALELLGPLLIFGPRRARIVAVACFTVFQGINILTANYGFFVYLSLGLHLFLLDDADLERFYVRLRWRPLERPAPPPSWRRLRSALVVLLGVLYLALSAAEARDALFSRDPVPWVPEALRRRYASFRVVNVYHLFAGITTERVEAELQTWDGARWTARHLRHKPGDLLRAPGWVAPHQPRLDFQLWFLGLAWRGPMPVYATRWLLLACREPSRVTGLLQEPLPSGVEAVRLVWWRYRFTDREARRHTGAWWRRELLGTGPTLTCADAPNP